MAVRHNQINLLPGRWKLPSNVLEFERKLQLISLGVLGVYLIFVIALFGWIGILQVKRSQVMAATQEAAKDLASLRGIEAGQELIKLKSALAVETFKNELNLGAGVIKMQDLVPENVQLTEITTSPQGLLGLNGTAPNAISLGSFLDTIEHPQDRGRKVFQKGTGTLNFSSDGKVQFTLQLGFVPEAAKTKIEIEK